ncbi:MAG: c-type cytochrome [Silicimonas sp.]|uniref:c-type cytochrome n=1 Tax=Marinovum algicola TaxID=42444 RepID=UPI0032EAB953
MNRLLELALGGVFFASAAPGEEALPAGDPEAGRKVAGMCRTCHGLDGYAKIPIAPHVGGEPAAYLSRQLTAFRDGTREHEMMTVVARGLSDQQILDVSSWYARHTATATLDTDAANAPELCSGCHGSDGIAVVEDAPHLAGETNIYIETQLKAYRTSKRSHEIMSDIAAALTDNEIRAAADWYAKVRLEIAPTD